MRPLIFGEVLFDRFPDGSVVLGGAPFNVAWHLQAFGLAPLVISRVGRDALGGAVVAAMTGWGMDRRGVQFDATHPTGTVEVAFQAGEPHYAIVDRVAYDIIAAGDAFCSVCLAGRLLAWPLAVTMQRAQQFASAIVGIRGATPTDKDFYRRFLDAWRMKAD